MIKRFENYVNKKKMILNEQKSKIMKFKIGGGGEIITKWT